jgi:hypothetical protein
MAYQGMLKRGNKMMRGGGKWDDLYDISSNILLLISYIFFGFATILLINAGANYNKANIDETAVDAGAPLIEQPIFEYLKRDNFMAVEDYLLAWNKPLAIIFICFIVFFGLIALVIKGDYKIILRVETLPYFLILIIFIAYTATTSNNNNFDDVNKELEKSNIGFDYEHLYSVIGGSSKDDRKYKKQIFFKELKSIVIDMLDNGENFTNDVATTKLLTKLSQTTIKDINEEQIKQILYKKDDVKSSVLKKIFDIYIDYKQPKNKFKYINHISNYFDLIISDIITDDNPNDNNYIKYYIYGLIKNKDDNDKNRLKDKLIRIKSSIQGYYIVVFVFYCLILVAILVILMGGPRLCVNYIKVYGWDVIKLSLKVMVGFFIIYAPILTMYVP